ncbi:CueP family metal-binding protein [Cellulomonas hominis]|uniref:CueP family metal-binding protein n=1 Tax=Cellulomonas hominis TaxID=156981 RepID=A0A511FAA9_9CELL|nr:CueP family metal-binding protein [Cellulomonas hominis]MBB5472065.1 hypothetical protein [Cellulomonas hominis]MBU5423406.1 CueP family metal-binding protein [Cellulomonas hominis]NKY08873.1 hypothetical protein [Cellulomonas hominis]GEL46201.1 hypothetical protein CHO01_13170 [Cellulomonas hominis]
MTTTRRPALPALAAALLLALTAACSPSPAEPTPTAVATADASADALDTYAAMGAEDLIAALEATPLDERPADLLASVRPHEVLLSRDGREVAVPAPEGKHYLSIAPYVSGTHDCFFHSLTTCTGELGGEQVAVTIVDDASGEVYVDETTTLHDNGFAGFWLPDGRTATVTVEADGRAGTATVSTGDEDLTCLTSLRLA